MTALDRIAGDRLCLDQVRAADLAELRAIFAGPGMAAFLPPATGGADPVAAMLDADLAHWRRLGIGRYLIRDGADPVGVAGLTDKPPFAGWNLSYHVAHDARGRGLATRAAAALLGAARGAEPTRRVYALILPPNPASERVLAKLGFVPGETVDYGGRRAVRWTRPA